VYMQVAQLGVLAAARWPARREHGTALRVTRRLPLHAAPGWQGERSALGLCCGHATSTILTRTSGESNTVHRRCEVQCLFTVDLMHLHASIWCTSALLQPPHACKPWQAWLTATSGQACHIPNY